MTDKLYDIGFDTGDKVIQCGRHNDIFKLWLQWRSEGDSGFEARMDRLMELTQYEVKRIREQSDKFYLIMEPELVNVSFWYIPKRLRGIPHNKHREDELAKVKSKSFFDLNRIQALKLICFLDLPNHQGSHDAIWNIDGWLSTRRPSPQFLPINHLVSCSHREGRRLHVEWDRQLGTRFVNNSKSWLSIEVKVVWINHQSNNQEKFTNLSREIIQKAI